MSCATCKWCEKGEIGKDLTRSLVCKRFPPSPLLVPGPQGPQLTLMFPPVNKEIKCGEYQLEIVKPH